jgi:phosphatidylglycerol:prolipoprotein diacylglycerol transferase
VHPSLSLVLGDIQIHTTSYRVFLSLAALSTVGLAWLVAARRGLHRGRSLACLLAMAVAFPVGARLFDAITKADLYSREPRRLLALDFNGFSMWGGLILAVAVGVTMSRLLSVDLVRLADSTMPGIGVGVALTRVGCFMAGCCYGRETDLPWGVTFPSGSNAHLHQLLGGGLLSLQSAPRPVHPTQLYEALAALAAVGFVLWLFNRRASEGAAFLACACWYSLVRLAIHPLRIPGGELVVPSWFYPALYTAILLVAGSALLVRCNPNRSRNALAGSAGGPPCSL